MKKIGLVLCLLLPNLVIATIIEHSNSSDSLYGKQLRINCYHQHQKIIPLAKAKLPGRQQLVDSYRCGTRLLQPEMTLAEVDKFCPNSHHPSKVERYLQSFEVHHRGFYGYHHVLFETYEMERWTFKQYGRFRTYIIFREGVIYQIIQDRAVRN